MILFLAFSLISAKLTLPNQLKANPKNLQASATPIQLDFTCKKVTDPIFNINNAFTPLIYSGYLNTPEGSNSAVSFIFYGAKTITDPTKLSTVPTIIWLQGGPGSSSMLGNFLELGPYKMDSEHATPQENQYSWHNQYNVMFIDQPIGTGFGYAEDVEVRPVNQKQIGDDLYTALVQFTLGQKGCVQLFSLTGLDKSIWFIFGESYAGKYVPTIGKTILQNAINKGQLQIQLKGLGYGDGFTDPASIVKVAGEFGYNLGLIDGQERITANQQSFQGLFNLRNKNWLAASNDFNNLLNTVTEGAGNVNVYNIFDYVGYNALEQKVATYLTTPTVVKALQFNENVPFKIQDEVAYTQLGTDFMQSDVVESVAWLLNEGTQMIIYNGQNDLIVPTPATVQWLEALQWKSSQIFQATNYTEWVLNKNVVGLKKKAANLQLQIVFNAGHLVPHDQPVNALDLVTEFITGCL